jgi:hypothetical protein
MPLSSPVTRTPQQLSPNSRHTVNGNQAIPSVNMTNGTVQTLQVFDPNLMTGNVIPRSPGSPTQFGKENGNGIPGTAFVSSSNGSVVLSSLDTVPRFNPSASGFKKYPGMPMTPNSLTVNVTGTHNNDNSNININNNSNKNENRSEENNEESESSSSELGTHNTIPHSLNHRHQNNKVLTLSNEIQRHDQDDAINRQLSIPQVCFRF